MPQFGSHQVSAVVVVVAVNEIRHLASGIRNGYMYYTGFGPYLLAISIDTPLLCVAISQRF